MLSVASVQRSKCVHSHSTATLLHNRVLVHVLVICTGTLQQSTLLSHARAFS